MGAFNDFKFINKGQKRKICATCGRSIDVGEARYNFVGNVNSDFQNWDLCEVCHKIFTELMEFNDDTYIAEDLVYDIIQEKIHSWKCEVCGARQDDFEIDTKNNRITVTCEDEHTTVLDLIEFVKKE